MRYVIGFKDGNITESFYEALERIGSSSGHLESLKTEAAFEVAGNFDHTGFVVYDLTGKIVEEYDLDDCINLFQEALYV
jgi:hypothetical protein